MEGTFDEELFTWLQNDKMLGDYHNIDLDLSLKTDSTLMTYLADESTFIDLPRFNPDQALEKPCLARQAGIPNINHFGIGT